MEVELVLEKDFQNSLCIDHSGAFTVCASYQSIWKSRREERDIFLSIA